MPHAGTVAVRLFLFLALVSSAPAQDPPQGNAPNAPVELTPEARADLAMVRQEYVIAIDFYRKAPQDSPDVWNKLGMAFHHLFAIDEAKRAYEHALRLRPKYPEALNNLGAVYYAKKDYSRAVRYYRAALALMPKSAPMYSNLGSAYFADEKYADGLVAFQKAFDLDPAVFNDSSMLQVSEPLPASLRAQQDYSIARLFAQSGKTDKALAYLRRALNEGFGDRRRIFGDQSLASVRATPEFAQLMDEEHPH